MVDVRFVWVDVFAETALTGNPLALIPEADPLTQEQMRGIAREFNQSETTFLVTPSLANADYRLRSFTPGGVEVFGAGHNAMGAWIWLATSDALAADRTEFTQQIGNDSLPVRIARSPAGAVKVTMLQSPPRFIGRTTQHADLAAALGLAADDLLLDRPAEVVSTGAEHLLVALRSRVAVDRATADSPRLKQILASQGAEGCYIYATESGAGDIDAYARFFNPTVGIAEDPATGTAAGPLAALLVRDGRAADGQTIRIEQGRLLGRPSILEVVVDGTRVELSGSGVVVADGTLRL